MKYCATLLSAALWSSCCGVAVPTRPQGEPAEERCEGTLLERYDAAWYRWSVEGLPMRDCDAEALADVRELAAAKGDKP